mgnify:CR=1 FL=1
MGRCFVYIIHDCICDLIRSGNGRHLVAIGFGGVSKEKPPEYPTVLEAWRRKELSARAAAARLGVTHKTFQKWAEQDTLR